ncbi:hypothetical protein IFM89_001304 [Coptis chinensis]|uniref:RNase H type-1 domain-containing protein n=1 Tax=Coptis chinensis TaxID=261450 RepID=A0A835IU08_9MAGN|nr:hypothetical protein IFM89_001304 [Coptis chinensis]
MQHFVSSIQPKSPQGSPHSKKVKHFPVMKAEAWESYPHHGMGTAIVFQKRSLGSICCPLKGPCPYTLLVVCFFAKSKHNNLDLASPPEKTYKIASLSQCPHQSNRSWAPHLVFQKCRVEIRKAIYRAYNLPKGYMDNPVHDLSSLHKLTVQMKYRKTPKMNECFWLAPPPGVIKINTDGSSCGNPGDAGWGSLYRDNQGVTLGVVEVGVEVETM